MRGLFALWKSRKELQAFWGKVQIAGRDRKFSSREYLTLYKPFMAFYSKWQASR